MSADASPEFVELNRRLSRLERANRRWRWGGIASLALVGLLLLGGAVQREEPPKSLRARSFVVVDEAGRETMRLGPGTDPKEPARIEILDRQGRSVTALGMREKQPFLILHDPEQKATAVLDVSNQFGPGLALRNDRRERGILLGVSPDGLTGLGIMNERGIPVINLGDDPNGTPRLEFQNREGKVLLRLP